MPPFREQIVIETEQVPYDAENDEFPPSFTVTIYARATDMLGMDDSAILVESDAHKRLPGVFPRFWHNRDSKLLVLDPALLDAEIDYTCIKIPLSDGKTSRAPLPTEPGDAENEPRSKRAKTTDLSTREVVDLYISSDMDDWLCLSHAIRKLEGSTHRTEALTGFVVTSLGGIPHMSYPPTLDQLFLYCEIISIYDQRMLPFGEFVATFANVLESLHKDPTFRLTDVRDLLYRMFDYVWVNCSQSRTCLEILAPFLKTSDDHKRLLKLIGTSVSRKTDAFVDFLHLSLAGRMDKTQRDPIRRIKTYVKLSLPESYSTLIKVDYAKGASFGASKLEFYRRGVVGAGDQRVKIFDQIDASFIPPLHLVSLSSALLGPDGEKSKMRLLVHKSLLVKHWPYFSNLMSSGLAESRTRTVELPLTEASMRIIVGLLYGHEPDWEDLEARYNFALDILAHGPQLGLLTLNPYVPKEPHTTLPLIKYLVTKSFDAFFSDDFVSKAVSSVEASIKSANGSHNLGLSVWSTRVLQALVEHEWPTSKPRREYSKIELLDALLHPDLLPELEELRKEARSRYGDSKINT